MKKYNKVTFLGSISACFFWTWWYNCAASFSQTWHLMYGMSSFLALATTFLEPLETGIHAETSNIDTTMKNRDFIFPITHFLCLCVSLEIEENKAFYQTLGKQKFIYGCTKLMLIWSFVVVKCSPKFTFSCLCTEWGTQKKKFAVCSILIGCLELRVVGSLVLANRVRENTSWGF